jgi:hypothetical protein
MFTVFEEMQMCRRGCEIRHREEREIETDI